MDAIIKTKLDYPKKINKTIEILLRHLKLKDKDIHRLKLTKVQYFKPVANECHINTMLMKDFEDGKQEFGWLVWYDAKNDFCEAIFHSVWRNSNELLIDITPRQHNEKRVLFIVDGNRMAKPITYEGKAALHTFSNVQVIKGNVERDTKSIISIIHSNLAREQGLIE